MKMLFCKAYVLSKSGKYGERIGVEIFDMLDPKTREGVRPADRDEVVLAYGSQSVAYVLPNILTGDSLLLKGYFQGSDLFFVDGVVRYNPTLPIGSGEEMIENTEEYYKYKWVGGVRTK